MSIILMRDFGYPEEYYSGCQQMYALIQSSTSGLLQNLSVALFLVVALAMQDPVMTVVIAVFACSDAGSDQEYHQAYHETVQVKRIRITAHPCLHGLQKPFRVSRILRLPVGTVFY